MSKWFVKLHLCVFECYVAFLKFNHELKKKKTFEEWVVLSNGVNLASSNTFDVVYGNVL